MLAKFKHVLMSVQGADPLPCSAEQQVLTVCSHPAQQQELVLKDSSKAIGSMTDETPIELEALNLSLLDVELSKAAAYEGVPVSAASPSTSGEGSSDSQQYASCALQSSGERRNDKSKLIEPGLVLQLVQQQSKFLDVLQSIIAKTSGPDDWQQAGPCSTIDTVRATAAASEVSAAANVSAQVAETGEHGAPDLQLAVLQQQCQQQVAENRALKKRCFKVQKAMLKHMQAARAQITAAQDAADEARRREERAAANNAALQDQLTHQQHLLQKQQQQMTGLQEQLAQLKDIHKKKLTRCKAQLQQQYESQLAAATAAYTQELSLVHAVQLCSGPQLTQTSAGVTHTGCEGQPTPRQVSKKARQSSASAGAVLVPAHQQSVVGSSGIAATSRCQQAGGLLASPAMAAGCSGLGARHSSGGTSSMKSHVREAGAPPARAMGCESSCTATTLSATACSRTDSHRNVTAPSHQQRSTSSELRERMWSGTAPGNQAQPCQYPVRVQAEPDKGGQSAEAAQLLGSVQVQGGPPDQPAVTRCTTAPPGAEGPCALHPGVCREQGAGSRSPGVGSVDLQGLQAATAAAAGALMEETAVEPGPVAGVDSSVAVTVAQQLQSHLLLLLAQQLAEHLPPELSDIDPYTILSLQQAVASHVEQRQDMDEAPAAAACEEPSAWAVQQGSRHLRRHGASSELDVPEEVLHLAKQYQHGVEGSSRPPTATPSALQQQREQQVPEAAAQLAQHFVTGGEGTSRPLTAPSSDRTRAMQQRQRSSSPSGRAPRLACSENSMVPLGPAVDNLSA